MYSWKNVIPSIETNNFCLHNYGDSKVRATYEAWNVVHEAESTESEHFINWQNKPNQTKPSPLKQNFSTIPGRI